MTRDPGLRSDAFLGGQLTLLQPTQGYRAGMDAVLLAAACPAKAGESVLDVGCGVGTAALCLGTRVPGLRLFGVERQTEIAEIARRNGTSCAQDFTVFAADITRPPDALKAESFNHAIMNPPYFRRSASSRSDLGPREAAMGEDTALPDLIRAAARRLQPGGSLTIIHRAERVPDILAALDALRFGATALRPLLPREGKPARLVLLQSRKGRRAAFRLLAPLVIHAAPQHARDGEDYTDTLRAILRDGASLPLE